MVDAWEYLAKVFFGAIVARLGWEVGEWVLRAL